MPTPLFQEFELGYAGLIENKIAFTSKAEFESFVNTDGRAVPGKQCAYKDGGKWYAAIVQEGKTYESILLPEQVQEMLTTNLPRFTTPQKTYASKTAMEADTAPIADDGTPFQKGWMVNIITADPSDADNQSIYYYQATGTGSTNWKFGGKQGSDVDLEPYAEHGYSSTETVKTLKQVDEYFEDEGVKVNDISNNGPGSLFVDINKDQWSTTSNNPNKTKVFVPSEITPFENAIKMNISASQTGGTYLAIAYTSVWMRDITVSLWMNVGLYSQGVSIAGYKGTSNTTARFTKNLGIANSNFTAQVKPTVDAGGVYQNATGELKIREYRTTGYGTMVHMEITVSPYTLAGFDCDYLLFGVGTTVNIPQAAQADYTAYFTGLQIREGTAFYNQATAVTYKEEKPDHVSSLSGKYNLRNMIIDLFRGTKNNTTDYNFLEYNTRAIFGSDIKSDGVDPVYKDKFVFYKEDASNLPAFPTLLFGINFPKFNYENPAWDVADPNNGIIDYRTLSFSFWIYVPDLNGNGLQGGDIVFGLSSTQLRTKGLKITANADADTTTTYVIINDVQGDYSHVTILNPGKVASLKLYINGSNPVSKLTIYNPTLIQSADPNVPGVSNVDPYHRYTSTAEKNGSKWIGKRLMISGDSQFSTQTPGLYAQEELGVTIINQGYPGHSIAILSKNLGLTNYNSFYNLNVRNVIFDTAKTVDLIWLTYSTNDRDAPKNANNSLTLAAVNAVLNNYPTYADKDNSSETSKKQNLFNALTAAQVDEMFAYEQTYSAFLKQLIELCPNTPIIMSTLPITASGMLTNTSPNNWATNQSADTARADSGETYVQFRQMTMDVAAKYCLPAVDLYSEVGLTYENFPGYCRDGGIHWTQPILKKSAYKIIDHILNKIKVTGM